MPGTSRKPLIIIDADAIIALNNTADTNHEKAKAVLTQLVTIDAYTLFPTTALCEAVTVLRGRLNNPEGAEQVMKQFQAGDFPLQEVGRTELLKAAALFHPQSSKKNTLFDAVVAAIAQERHAEAIFSFDEWYRKLGFTLAEELPDRRETSCITIFSALFPAGLFAPVKMHYVRQFWLFVHLVYFYNALVLHVYQLLSSSYDS